MDELKACFSGLYTTLQHYAQRWPLNEGKYKVKKRVVREETRVSLLVLLL